MANTCLTEPKTGIYNVPIRTTQRALLATPKAPVLLLAALLPFLHPGEARGQGISPPGAADGQPTRLLQLASGPIKGKLSNGAQQFLGIPYAAAPVGDLRWKPPQPLPSRWTEVRDVVAYGPTCAQSLTLGVFAAPSQSEDCLYLNVFTPSHPKADVALPVMVWIHGGGLFDGESNDYDGSKLARDGGIIVVTINYRLNIFGFLALPGLDDAGHAFANYGLMDQQAALGWVHSNIAAFGGDPNNVTLAGESAGAVSVFLNLISPTAKGLFNRAIAESGSLLTKIVDVATAEANGADFAQTMGCAGGAALDVVACLRKRSVQQIQAEARRFNSNPLITSDGTTIARSFADAVRSGDFNQVPVIVGTNDNEFRFITVIEGLEGKPLSADEYAAKVRDGAGFVPGLKDNVQVALERYPVAKYQSANFAYDALATDFIFNSACDALTLDSALARFVPVYAYLFADVTAPSYQTTASLPPATYHTAELQYLFPLFHGAQGTGHPLSEAQGKLSDAMVQLWSGFAKSGNPSSSSAVRWPRYARSEGSAEMLRFDPTGPVIEPASRVRAAHNCDLWDGLPSRNPASQLR